MHQFSLSARAADQGARLDGENRASDRFGSRLSSRTAAFLKATLMSYERKLALMEAGESGGNNHSSFIQPSLSDHMHNVGGGT